jgi:DNA-binding IclR family transcriptional regulator
MTDEGKMINIDGITSPRMVRNVGWIGREMPAHTVSGGKVMLAYLPDGRVDQILAHELKSATPQTITSPAELRQELGWIRARGYGMAEGELEEGLSAVAAPIWNHEGQVVAIISISGPSFRLPRRCSHLES